MCDLLDELWSLIFRDHLDDLVAVLRMREVCKRFKFLVDQLGLSEVLIFRYPVPFLNVLKVDKEPRHWIRWDDFQLEQNCPKFIGFRNLFANLKHLQMSIADGNEYLNLEVLNEFTKLEKLYVASMLINRDLVLRLPMLKTLSVRLRSERERHTRPNQIWRINYDEEPHLVVHSKVETLICERLNLIRLIHPECIEVLESEIASRDNVASFQNLRVLHTFITKAILDKFQSLNKPQEIYLSWKGDAVMPARANEQIRMIDQLASKNRELGKNVNIFFLNFPLTRPVKEHVPGLPGYSWSSNNFDFNLMAARIRHYHQLIGPVPCVEHVHYPLLIRSLDAESANFFRNQVILDDHQFPVDFFRKFPDIRKVYLGEAQVDEERFLHFLGQCPKLVHLKFLADSLRQPILDRLPLVCRRLQVLYVRGGRLPSSLDFSPIYKLKQLFTLWFTVKLENPLNWIRLLEECRYLSRIWSDSFRIERSGPKSFQLEWNEVSGYVEMKNLSYEQLKENFEKICLKFST